MKTCLKWIVCSFMVLTFGTSWAGGPTQIMTEELPPFNFTTDGAVGGISADALVQIMAKAGNPITPADIKILPWARAYNSVQNEPGTLLFSMARTAEREALFKWVGPIYELTIGMIAPKSKGIQIAAIADAEKYKVGTVIDGAPEQLLIKAGFPQDKLDRIPRPDLNVKKLAAGRIDIFVFNVPTALYLIKNEGLNPGDYEVVHTLKTAQLHYAFHKDTDDALIAALNKALTELKQPGADGKSAFDKIVEKYLGAQ